MPNENVMYCFSRKGDAEKLAQEIKENKGILGYATVRSFGGMYSLKCGDIWHLQHVTFDKLLSYILRKWW